MYETPVSSPVRYWIALVGGSALALWAAGWAVAMVVVPVPGWVWLIALPTFGFTAWFAATLPRLRRMRLEPAGLRLHGWRVPEAVVPWARIQRMRHTIGQTGAAWIVTYADDAGVERRVVVPCWPGADGPGGPRPVEAVEGAWRAAGMRVARRSGWGYWELTPEITEEDGERP